MPAITYVPKTFSKEHETLIGHANAIIAAYRAEGYLLTLRQLYYQFVARDLIPNTVQSYKRLGGVINDARLAGRVDWTAIEDRTRNLHRLAEWDSPETIIDAVAEQFRIDKWASQPYRVEVWVEKEALAGVFTRVADELAVPMFACRGYVSQSEMWAAAQRLVGYARSGQTPLILHFGDHDPSGIDMTRDITDRLELFSGSALRISRVALNMDQVTAYEPPPNPAKETDSRFQAYLSAYGDESWELDALEPAVLADLVREEVGKVLDQKEWDAAVEEENQHKALLAETSRRWASVVEYLQDDGE
jgi:hypothetical protein